MAGRVLVTASGNATEVFCSRGPPGREGPGLPGGSWKRMPHYAAHVTCSHKASSSRDSPPVGYHVLAFHLAKGREGAGYRLATGSCLLRKLA